MKKGVFLITLLLVSIVAVGVVSAIPNYRGRKSVSYSKRVGSGPSFGKVTSNFIRPTGSRRIVLRTRAARPGLVVKKRTSRLMGVSKLGTGRFVSKLSWNAQREKRINRVRASWEATKNYKRFKRTYVDIR